MTSLATDTVSPRSAARALDALEQVLGPESVQRGAEAIAEFLDPYGRPGPPGQGPAGVVQPASTEEVRHVLRVASKYGVPVWTSSMGRNYGYGGAEPAKPGVIVLNLRRMNRVLEINPELGYAVIEPGVSFFDLYEALRAGGHPYWISCPDLGWGSVIGNALEHGVGYTQFGEHAGALHGLEVVLADGDVIRTGMGGIETADGEPSPLWHLSKRGFGPSVDELFIQSNLGVVTRAGIWLMPEPEAYTAAALTVAHEEDLPALTDMILRLKQQGVIGGYPIIQHGFGAVAMLVPRDQWPPISETAAALEQLGLPFWFVSRLSLYGPPAVVAARRAQLEEAVAQLPGAELTFREYTAPYSAQTVHPDDHVGGGIPSLALLSALDAVGGADQGGHVDVSPITPLTGAATWPVYRAAIDAFARHEVYSFTGLLVRDRTVAHVSMILFERADEAGRQRAWDCVHELVGRFDEMGTGEYRSHPDFAAEVAAGYTFNDRALHRLLRTLKDALDPRGILSPGRHGIRARKPGQPNFHVKEKKAMSHEFPAEMAFTGIYRPSRAEVDLAAAEVTGAIPAELEGTYYRVGPDPTYPPFHKNFAPVVDGNGMMVMFRFHDGQVDVRSRYVRTERFQLERAANRALFGEYRNPFTDDPSVKGKDRGTANTTVREHAGVLWALKEDALGVQVEELTLKTVGTNDFGGRVTSKTMTAHPKFDTKTGEMIFYGSAAKGETTPDIACYVADRAGQIVKEEWIVAPYASMVHDFAVTENWIVFPVLPTAASMERIKAGGPMYDWEPERGAYLGLMPRAGTAADVRWIEIEPLWFYHAMNAFETPDGRIQIDVSQSLVQSFPWFHVDPARTWSLESAVPRLTRWTLDPVSGAFSRKPLTDIVGDLPRIDDRFELSAYRHGYLTAMDPSRPPRGLPGGGPMDSIAHIDHETGEVEFAYAGDEAVFEEAQFVPRSPDAPEGDGFLIAIRHHWDTLATDLVVHDTQDLTEDPVAVVSLPFRLRPGTHGTWVPGYPEGA